MTPDPWVRIAAGRSTLPVKVRPLPLPVPARIIRLMRTEDPNLRGQAAEIMGKVRTFCQGGLGGASFGRTCMTWKDHVRKSAENALNAVSPIE